MTRLFVLSLLIPVLVSCQKLEDKTDEELVSLLLEGDDEIYNKVATIIFSGRDLQKSQIDRVRDAISSQRASQERCEFYLTNIIGRQVVKGNLPLDYLLECVVAGEAMGIPVENMVLSCACVHSLKADDEEMWRRTAGLVRNENTRKMIYLAGAASANEACLRELGLESGAGIAAAVKAERRTVAARDLKAHMVLSRLEAPPAADE